MFSADIPKYTQPQSIEQRQPLPRDVFDDCFSYTHSVYGMVGIQPRIGTAESRTAEVKNFVELLYQDEKQKIVGNTFENNFSPFQKSELDQLDAWRTDVLQRLNGVNDGIISNTIDNASLPLSSDEVKTHLVSIKEAFGLTTKDLAAFLRVERQTVYAWLRGENKPSLENSRRIRAIFSFAEEWNQLSKLPAKPALRIPLSKNNDVLLDLLTCDVLNETAIRRQLQIAVKFVNERQLSRPSIEQILREKGLDPAKYRVPDSEFDAMTGKAHFSSEDWE